MLEVLGVHDLPVAPQHQLRLLSRAERRRPKVDDRLGQIAQEVVVAGAARENLVALVHIAVAVQLPQRDFLRQIAQRDGCVINGGRRRDPEILVGQANRDIRPGNIPSNRSSRLGADSRPGNAVIADLEGQCRGDAAPFHAHSIHHRVIGEIHRVAGGSRCGRAREQLQGPVVEVQHLNRASRQRDNRLVLVHRQDQLLNAPAGRLDVRQLGKHQIEAVQRVGLHFGRDCLGRQTTAPEGVINHLQGVKGRAAYATRVGHAFSAMKALAAGSACP